MLASGTLVPYAILRNISLQKYDIRYIIIYKLYIYDIIYDIINILL